MVEILIDGNAINVDDSQSITFKEYNALFDAAEGKGSYSFDIDVNLKDPVNARVYKHLNRLNTINVPTKRNAVVKVDGRILFDGTETILKIEEDLVKIQILCGNSQINFAGQNLNMKDLNLGTLTPLTREQAADTLYREYPTAKSVCCPVMRILDWFPYNEDKEKFVNWVERTSMFETKLRLAEDTTIIQQPYLLLVIDRVFLALGWKVTYNCLLSNPYAKRMIVVHAFETLEVNKMVPNWNVNKFLEEVQKLFNVLFICDDIEKTVGIYNINDYYDGLNDYHVIDKNEIVDTEPLTRDMQEEQGYAFNYDNVGYNFPSVHFYNQAKLNEEVLKLVETLEFNSISEFNTDEYKKAEYYNKPYLFHDKTTDTYWVLTKRSPVGTLYHFERVQFFENGHGQNYNEEESQETTLSIVPAEIYCLDIRPVNGSTSYLMGGAVAYARNSEIATTDEEITTDKGLNEWIEGDLPEDIDTSGNALYVAQYMGVRNVLHGDSTNPVYNTTMYPMCAVTRWMAGIVHSAGATRYEQIYDLFKGSSSLANEVIMDLRYRVKNIYKNNNHINNKEKFEICYESRERVDVKKMFLIDGRKFACVATEYTIEGGHLSKVVKGTFLPYD